MNKNSVWNILFVLFLILGQFTTTESVSAKPNQEEAPQVPNLLSPGNGSTASSNPPTLCAQASDPDGNLQGIKFEVNGGGEGDHISPFVQVDANGVACWQDNSPWSEQDHAWQARSVDTAGNQSGASGQWNIKIPVTTAPAAQSETCTVNELYADRPAPQTVGTTINFTVVATCGNGINKIETFVDGSGVGTIYSGSGTISWNTNRYGAGNHVFSVQVFGNSGGSAGRSHPYDLVNSTQEQQQTNPNSSFGNCEAVKIGYDVFVIVKEGSAIQRRHVPNPETLDALGFSQQTINNKGFSDSELKTIGQGSDIPDVVVDPNSFNTFKSTFCPNRNAIVPNQSTSQLPVGQFDPHASGVCPGWETRLWIGAYARITNPGDQLKLRTGPTLNDSVITKMSAGQKFTVIGGPQCNDSYTWWNIQGDMGTGWAAEAGDKWWMAPMTEAPVVTSEVPITPPSADPCEISSNSSLTWVERLMGVTIVHAESSHPDKPNCARYVYNKLDSKRLKECGIGPDYKSGGKWDNWILEIISKSNPCNITVKTLVANDKTVQSGDIVVWDGYIENHNVTCTGVADHSIDVGHVAFFVQWNSDGKTFSLDGENWSGNPNKVSVNSSCMHVIHIPGSGYIQSQQNDTENQIQSDTEPTDKCIQFKNNWFKWIWCKFVG